MRILLGVCGSISAYKSLDLARGLINAGHQVKVVLTRGAENFVRPQVFRYLGALDVYTSQDDFDYPTLPDQGEVLHIDLAKWTQRFVVAPFSANTLAKFAMGQAGDLLTSVFLALERSCPTLFFPAMNGRMLEHPIVQDNQKILQRLESLEQVFFAPTLYGKLACGDESSGKLLALEHMLELIPYVRTKLQDHSKNILITTGATISKLDPIRYLTNPASGRTGLELAKYFHSKGHKVTLVYALAPGSKNEERFQYLKAFPNLHVERVHTTAQMHDKVQHHFPTSDVYISSAAIGDIEFDQSDQKLKKENLATVLNIKKSVDILAEVIKLKKANQKIIGFAAETQLTDEVLKEKMNKKPVDLLIGTEVHSGEEKQNIEMKGFMQEAAVYKVWKPEGLLFGGQLNKQELAEVISQELSL